MPVYEYLCSNGHQFDRTEGFDAARQQPCPICGKIAQRKISLPAVIFKGPGFYSTDNRSGSRSANGTAADSAPHSPSSEGQGHSPDDTAHSNKSEAAAKAEPAASD